MLRLASWTEEVRGVEVMSMPWPGETGRRFGLLLLEPIVGGWNQKMFIGWFRRKGADHGR